MNDTTTKSPIIVNDIKDNNEKKDESIEDYQIIQEDYCSSPKCGIRSKIVTKSVEKIIVSPIEISTHPYFKYSITPVKDEHMKCDFSQSETNNTRIQEEIKSKKNINNIFNNQKTSYIEIIKDELKEEKSETESEDGEKLTDKSNYLNILKNKESAMTIELNNNINRGTPFQVRSAKLKSRKINLHKISSFNYNNNHHSIKLKEKLKLLLNENNENIKGKKKAKASQKLMHNILMLVDDKKKKSETNMISLVRNIDNNNCKSIFNSLKLKKENIKNIKQKFSPFKIGKERKEPFKVKSSLTSTDLKGLIKKKKRPQENGLKKIKTTHNIQFDPNNKTKRGKKEENMNDNNNNNEDFILNKPKKKKSKHKKMKSLGERVNANLNKEIKRSNENEDKTKNNDKDKGDIHDNFSKRRANNFHSIKLNINDTLRKKNKIFETPSTAKKRRRSIFDFNLDESRKKNILINIRKEKEKKEISSNKKKSTFSNKVVTDKEKQKEKNKEKEKENLNKRKNTKDKKDRKKSKKKDKNKPKNKDKDKNLMKENKDKDKNIETKINLNIFNKKSKEKNQLNKKINNQFMQVLSRKKKSHTILYHNINKSLFNRDSAKKLSLLPFVSESAKSSIKNALTLKRIDSRELSLKNDLPPNQSSSRKFTRCTRRHSTKILFHNKSSQKEKITDYTNKQTIDNLNEYIKQCLEIIPDLYELDEMPRCKNKIHPDFLKKNLNTKKVALFDLDETIVHCIGEINMNNVENFSRQGDAKIKVQLPGGKQITIGINIRPHWEQALDIIRDKYHIIAYTASHESYADSVLNYLDPDKKYFEYRLYRSHCVLCVINEMKFYVKDLGILEDCCDLKDVVLIDNSVLSFAYHLDNGIPISPFYDSKNDCELLDISNFLLKYADENDIRDRLREVYKLNEYLEIIKNYSSEDSFTGSSSISIVQEDEEGEKTNKNNNKYMELNLSKSSKNNTIHEKEEDSLDIKDNNNTFYLNDKIKNCSQRYFKFKEIIDLFDNEEKNDKMSKSFSLREKRYKKLESKSNINKNIDKSWCLVKKKNKYKSFRNFDINFKKEWDEKQKELNNNK